MLLPQLVVIFHEPIDHDNSLMYGKNSGKLLTLPGNILTHWGPVTHICISDLTSIGSDNGLAPGWRQTIIRTNDGLLLIGPLGTNFSDTLIEILTFSFKNMRLKVSSAKRRPFCLGLNVLSWHVGPRRITQRKLCRLGELEPISLKSLDWVENWFSCDAFLGHPFPKKLLIKRIQLPSHMPNIVVIIIIWLKKRKFSWIQIMMNEIVCNVPQVHE